MKKIIIYSILLVCLFLAQIPSATARTQKLEQPPATLICFSGGEKILQKEVISGPFADEYKYAHEVRVKDERGEYNLNFAGGLCIIDRGVVSLTKELSISDRLSCYSGAVKIVDFAVYGRESTVDEYLEGRTFVAQAQGNYLNFETPHRYLIFGEAACLGEESN